MKSVILVILFCFILSCKNTEEKLKDLNISELSYLKEYSQMKHLDGVYERTFITGVFNRFYRYYKIRKASCNSILFISTNKNTTFLVEVGDSLRVFKELLPFAQDYPNTIIDSIQKLWITEQVEVINHVEGFTKLDHNCWLPYFKRELDKTIWMNNNKSVYIYVMDNCNLKFFVFKYECTIRNDYIYFTDYKKIS